MKIIKDKKTSNEKNIDNKVFIDAEEEYQISIRTDIKDFLNENSGGIPINKTIFVGEEQFEVRRFLSLDSNDHYWIEKPMNSFLKETKGKIIPIGIDSGANYYCVNNETGKVYFWNCSEEEYYCIANSIEEFIGLFKKD